MAYTVYDSRGFAVAGDDVLDDEMRKAADHYKGVIKDDDNNIVYEASTEETE